MSITFHCEYCGKKIKAPDGAGGKWSNCPSCNNKLYIPDLSLGGEELKLAPIDESDEAQRKKLMAETYKLQQDILQEREEDKKDTSSVLSKISDKQLTIFIINYLRQTADGQLGPAEEALKTISCCGDRAVRILDRIALSEIPEPELADIEPQVLSGLIRTLRNKIS